MDRMIVENQEEYASWVSLFTNNFEENGVSFPSIDLFFTPRGNLQLKAAAAVAVLSRIQHRESEQSAFQNIYIVAPKGVVSMGQLGDAGMPAPSNVHLFELEQLSAEGVLDRLTQCSERSAVLILQGALYVFDETEVSHMETNAKFSLAEDLWAPQLHRLVRRIEEANTNAGCYVLVDAGKLYPGRAELQAPFMSINSLAIIADNGTAKRNELLAQHLKHWAQMLDSGRVGSVLQSVEELPQEFNLEKPLLRIQMLHAAGLAGHALDEIDKLNLGSFNVAATLAIAKIAAEAGGLPKSRALLEKVRPDLLSVTEFETAIAVARIIGSAPLQQRIEEQYNARYPAQSTQRRRNIQSLISTGQFDQASSISDASAVSLDMQAALNFCGTRLKLTEFPNYAGLAQELKSGDSWAHTAFVWTVNDALRRHALYHAFELVFGNLRPNRIQTLGAHAFVLMRELLLAVDSKGNFPVDEEKVLIAFQELVRYVAARPAEHAYRFEIESLLSHQIVGRKGVALLLHQILHADSPSIIPREEQDARQIDYDAVVEKLRDLGIRLGQEGIVVAGRLSLDDEVFSEGIADGILSILRKEIEETTAAGLSTDDAISDVLMWLSIASIAAPHSSQVNADLELYRHVAGRMANAGHPQQARNLIDLVLLGGAPEDLARRREAWFVCADIYARLNQINQGLVALACGLSTVVPVDLESALREADVCSRLLRDGGAPELAIHFHKRSSELLHLLQQYESQAVIHEYVGFTIEFAILQRPPFDRNRLSDLIRRMQINAQEVLARDFPAQPMALLLGQVILIAEQENVSVPSEAKAICDMLGGKLAGHEANLYQQVATEQTTARGLLKLHQAGESARYARDAAFDSGPAAVAARRLLARSQIGAGDTIFALELLSDRAMSLPGWQTTARPVPPLASTTEPGNWAAELSRRGIDVVVIGLDEQGVAHAVLARHGQLAPPKRLQEEFSTGGFRKWKQHYPYLYGIDEKTPNLFYVSTEGLNFPFDLERPTAIVASNQLQQLPPTLYRVEDRFAGQLQPLFSAPSLSWLYAASSSPSSTNKRLTGWISVAEQQGHTLVFAKERLEETIETHGVELNTGKDLPDGFWGSELSLVVAHGSVLPEGKYFQRVSDEGTLRVTTDDFAKAFKNVGVVVLFVCSAGRADESPEGESTYGLARELLAQGCSAVVASPWPLDSRVPYHWFPTFMDVWSEGKSVAEATFIANQHVEKHFSSSLANRLAMTVFGDGMRLRMK